LARRHGWSDDQLEHLAEFRNRTDFTDAEKAALELAERVTRDPHEVDDDFWAGLRRYYDDGEIIELLAAIGLFNYFNRFNDALRMEPTK
jgi:alkylhydroperoxidase family enzyme